MQVCPNCGEENPDRFRLCGICGTALAQATPATEVRKTVTVVYSDLKGSTALGETLDTESLREVLNLYFRAMQGVLERHGGTVEKFIGDAIMAVFGLPTLHEDDALRAVRAAFEMQQALERLNVQLESAYGVRLENRTGVNTGEVVAGDVTAGQRLVTGDTVNTAARLEQAAPALEILIGAPTYGLVKDAVDVEPVEPLGLKGKARPVPAYRLLAVHGASEGVARRLDAPMVGRERELAELLGALDAAERERRPQLVTVFGPAGAGKSRLLREFLARTEDRVASLRGRCLSYGDGITFWPLAEIVREAAGIHPDDTLGEARRTLSELAGEGAQHAVERIAAAMGLSDATFAVQETYWAARKLVERLARDRATVLLIDDIHWAERTFLDMLGYLTDTVEAPLLLLCSSRPELLEDHADWGSARDGARSITLEPLTDGQSAEIAENLLGSDAFDERLRKQIVEAAQGNPLFVEQLLSMLVDNGSLVRDETGRWALSAETTELAIPPTISALLSARLDRLGPDERSVIERGAVMGAVFFEGAVMELSPDDVRAHVPAALASLVRKQLIQPHPSVLAGFAAFKFGHILIRDAAYGGLLKRTRAVLHERLVDWLERLPSDRVMEYEEIHGYHLEQAYLARIALGTADERTLRVGERGAEYLSSAGRRALGRGDMPAAASLLQRAAALLPAGDRRRPDLLTDAGDALIELGEFSEADALLAAAIDEATAASDRGTELASSLARLWLHYVSEGAEDEGLLMLDVERAIEELTTLDHHVGLARGWRLLMEIHWTALRWGAAERTAERWVDEARRAGDPLAEARALPALPVCAAYGPAPVEDAIRLCEETLLRIGDDRKARSLTFSALARLEAMRGEFERARELYRDSRAALEEHGWTFLAALTSLDSGPVEMLAGAPEAAEQELRRDYETLHRLGERNYLSTTAALLAEALYEQGRYEDALELTLESEEVAAQDDVLTQVRWRAVRGKVLARFGRLEKAEALAREALRAMEGTDAPAWLGALLMDVAEIRLEAGKTEEARAATAEALRLFEQKGNLVSASRARTRLAEEPSSGGHDVAPLPG